jgi:hypothetical protein
MDPENNAGAGQTGAGQAGVQTGQGAGQEGQVGAGQQTQANQPQEGTGQGQAGAGQEGQASVTGHTTEQLLELNRKKNQEAQGLRTRLKELESEKAARDKELEDAKPLQERLTAAEKRALEREQAADARLTQADRAVIRADLISDGVPANVADDASVAFRAARDAMPEEERDLFTVSKFLETRPYFKTSSTGGAADGQNQSGGQGQQQPSVVLGGARSAVQTVITAQSLETMSQTDYEKNRDAIHQAAKAGSIR